MTEAWKLVVPDVQYGSGELASRTLDLRGLAICRPCRGGEFQKWRDNVGEGRR